MDRRLKKTIIAISFTLILQLSIFGSYSASQTTDETFYKTTPIPIDLIETLAYSKLGQLGKENDYQVGAEITPITNEEGENLCYFLCLDPCGYIVISAYYELPMVIAYSFSGLHQLDNDQHHQFFSFLETDITMRLEHLDLLPEELIQNRRDTIYSLISDFKDPLFQQWPSEGTTPTEGWVETTWHQSSPFNDFSPIDLGSGQRSLAGCPAVAMAQILNYHRTINNITFSDIDDYYHNYAGNHYMIDDDYSQYMFPSFPQLNAYLHTLIDHYTMNDTITDTDKAALSFACGVACKQVYNPSGSGTFGVAQAYDAYQRFDFSSAILLDEDDPDIYLKLADNMKNAIPAHLAIVNEEWTSGHNLVVDGYNTDDYFHLNFGWNGAYDGWYLLPDELPFSLTVIEGIILDIATLNTTLDIVQNEFDRGFPVRYALDGDWAAAQNFTPTVDTITKVDVYLRKMGTPEFDLTVELREDGPEATLLDTVSIPMASVPGSWTWLEIDFTDVSVDADSDIFIVIPPVPSGVTTSFGYEWGYAFGDQYPEGSFWFTRDGGALWRDLPTMYEYVFRTYGY